jgi:reactive chlorine resistance protein C
MHSTTSPAIAPAPYRPSLELYALAAAPRLEKAAGLVSRWGLVAILLALGAFKFTAGEAADIKPLVENSPLMGWLYRVTSVQGASNLIGVIELATAALLAAHRWAPRAAALGGLVALSTFATTLSFLVTTPGVAGHPETLGFLLKDVFLFGAALSATAASLRAVAAGRTAG